MDGLYTKYYLRFWLSSCRTSLAVSALRIMRYCPYKKALSLICIANKGKCFCFAHYEVTIAKDTVNSQ